jgi:hypothetical protein
MPAAIEYIRARKLHALAVTTAGARGTADIRPSAIFTQASSKHMVWRQRTLLHAR